METDLRDYAANAIFKYNPSSKVELGTILEGGVENNRFDMNLFREPLKFQTAVKRHRLVNLRITGSMYPYSVILTLMSQENTNAHL